MSNYKYFIGVDVSKSTLDIALYRGAEYVVHTQIENSISSVNEYFNNLVQSYENFTVANVLVCLENTGRYMNFILSALSSLSYCVWIENAYSIKHSLGLKRGKNDKADAKNIGEYAYRFSDKANLYTPSSLTISKLEALQAVRSQLIESRKRLTTELNESRQCDDSLVYKIKKKASARTLKALEKDIEATEKDIENVIRDDEELTRLMKILCSVPGVGKVTSVAFIIITEAFTKFDSAKQLACYCGVVPFDNRSGTSLKGKSKVSKKSNRKMKTLLTMCARSLIGSKGELGSYYQRKIEEGKQKMVALNALQNKIIHRIFALVRDDREYQKEYQNKFA